MGILKAFEQRIGSTEILDDNRAGTAVNATGLDNVVIGVPVDDLTLDAGHGILVYTHGLVMSIKKLYYIRYEHMHCTT